MKVSDFIIGLTQYMAKHGDTDVGFIDTSDEPAIFDDALQDISALEPITHFVGDENIYEPVLLLRLTPSVYEELFKPIETPTEDDDAEVELEDEPETHFVSGEKN